MDKKSQIAQLFKKVLELAKQKPEMFAKADLGQTRSGKLIPYNRLSAEDPIHESYTAEDHADAAQAYATKAKQVAEESMSTRDAGMRMEANKLLARARFHGDKQKAHHAAAESQAAQQAKLTPNKFVHVNQHHSAILNRNPNPIQGQPKHLDDLTRLAEYHGHPQHQFSATPDKRLGYETYQVNPDKSLKFMHADYDSSD